MVPIRKISVSLLLTLSLSGCLFSSRSLSGPDLFAMFGIGIGAKVISSPDFSFVDDGVKILGEDYRKPLACIKENLDQGYVSKLLQGVGMDVTFANYYQEITTNKMPFNGTTVHKDLHAVFGLEVNKLEQCCTLNLEKNRTYEEGDELMILSLLLPGNIEALHSITEELLDKIIKTTEEPMVPIGKFNAITERMYQVYASLLSNDHQAKLDSWKTTVMNEGQTIAKDNQQRLSYSYILGSERKKFSEFDDHILYNKSDFTEGHSNANRRVLESTASYLTLVTDLCDNGENSILGGLFTVIFDETEGETQIQKAMQVCKLTPRAQIEKAIVLDLKLADPCLHA